MKGSNRTKPSFSLRFAAGILLLSLFSACCAERGLPGSTYHDSEFGKLTLLEQSEGFVDSIQVLSFFYEQTPLPAASKIQVDSMQRWAAFAYLTLANGDSVKFLENYFLEDSGTSAMRMGPDSREPLNGTYNLIIPKFNVKLPPGHYKATLKLETRLMEAWKDSTTSNGPRGEAIYWGELPVEFDQPEIIAYEFRVQGFDLAVDDVEARNFDWPWGYPDLMYKVIKNIGEYYPCNTVHTSNAISRNAVRWEYPEDSLCFVMARGDYPILAIYDWDDLTKNDFLGDTWLDMEALSNKPEANVADFGKVKNCRLRIKAEPVRYTLPQ